MAHFRTGFPTDQGSAWKPCHLCSAHKYKRVELRFDCGATEPTAGEVLTGSQSTDRATVLSWVLEGGSWAGGDAYGTIELSMI